MASPFEDDEEQVASDSPFEDDEESPAPAAPPSTDAPQDNYYQPSAPAPIMPPAGTEEAQGDSGDQDLAAMAAPADEEQPIEAPKAPVFKDYSQAPVEAAQELAQAKSDFNPANYKPSTGRRILAGIAGGLQAFGSNPNAEQTIQNVEGRPLQQAQRVEAQKESAIQARVNAGNAENQNISQENARIANAANWAERDFANQAKVRDWQAQEAQRKAQAQKALNTVDKNTLGPVDPNNPFGEWQGKTPGGQIVRGLDPPASIKADPRYQAQEHMAQLKAMKDAGIKLTQEQEAIVASGGKITPAVHTTVEIRENPDGTPVAPKSSFTPAMKDEILRQKNEAMTRAQQAADSGTMDDETAQQAMQDAQNNYEQRIGQATGQSVPHLTIGKDWKWTQEGGAPAAPQAPAPQRQAAAPAQQPAAAGQKPQTFQYKGATFTVGQQIKVDGKPATVVGVNPQTGKPIVK